MRRLLSSSVIALVLGFAWTPNASAQQSVNLFLGGFVPRSIDGRGSDDVLYQNSFCQSASDPVCLSTLNRNGGIDIGKFNGVTFGGEYLVGLGPLAEAGLGIGFYQRSVPTVSTNFVNPDGSEITQELKLRIVPLSATVRFLPLGHDGPIQPYVGAGVGVFIWKYSETGSFVGNGGSITSGSFSDSGSTVGPVILGGVRVPVADAVSIGGEVRWQHARADLASNQGFAGTKIDLGGVNYLFTVNVRF